jgi:hypothetical protein
VQANFTGANASATGQVAINDNDIYEEAEEDVAFTYGASTISVQNATGLTWPAGALIRVQAARTATPAAGGGGSSLTAATLVATMAEAAADEALGPQMGEQIDAALATREEEDQRTALATRGALILADGESPEEDDLTAFTEDGEAKVAEIAFDPAEAALFLKEIAILVFDDSQDVVVGDGAGDVFVRVPSSFNGMNVVSVGAQVQTAGVTGTTDIQVARIRAGTPVDVLSTKVTIDSTEIDSSTATASVVNAANDDLATGDQFRIDVDAVSTTKPKGLVVTIIAGFP